jgi:hypothetical protein
LGSSTPGLREVIAWPGLCESRLNKSAEAKPCNCQHHDDARAKDGVAESDDAEAAKLVRERRYGIAELKNVRLSIGDEDDCQHCCPDRA